MNVPSNTAVLDGTSPMARAPRAEKLLQRRRAGLLLHVTSLPGRFGIGDLGKEARWFVNFLQRTGQTIWQVLPLGPTGYGNSPYQSFSSFAGNPWLISAEMLLADHLVAPSDLDGLPSFPQERVDFEAVSRWHESVLRRSFDTFRAAGKSSWRNEHDSFCGAEEEWLDEFALFMAIKSEHPTAMWTGWPRELIDREPRAMTRARSRLAGEIDFQRFVQFLFRRQWLDLKRYANDRGVLILGDVPIFVSHDSADVWAHQSLFWLDQKGTPAVVAGVPPDYFSASGQRWGNPLYRWDRLAERSYDWWVYRVVAALRILDLVRMDHFRGFESYWEIPAESSSAQRGCWQPGPGEALFQAIKEHWGELPIIVEDLGVITPAVDMLRDRLGLPGMRVLQFAFGTDPKAPAYRPHHYVPNTVVYTGTHDNDTTQGWFASRAHQGTTRTAEEIEKELSHALHYLQSDGRQIHWDFIRAAWGSVANTAIAPLQDVLGLGTEARMNLPGTSVGNWAWRFHVEMLTSTAERHLTTLTDLYERGP